LNVSSDPTNVNYCRRILEQTGSREFLLPKHRRPGIDPDQLDQKLFFVFNDMRQNVAAIHQTLEGKERKPKLPEIASFDMPKPRLHINEL
jgi:hypothetical protein